MAKQNIYDNDSFFENFKNLRNNKINFNDCIETPILLAMIPEVDGKRVLDIGCGMGQHAKQYSDMGAESVLGIDISEKMLEYAKEHFHAKNITYRQMALEDICQIDEQFDLITSSLAFDYAEDLDKLMKNIYGLLKYGAHFVFSMSHPMATAWDGQYDRYTRTESGERLYANISNYMVEGKRTVKWVVEDYEVYHRTFSSIVNTIAQSNSTTIVLPLAAIIVFIIISGYLLIYNILYISISRDTQFYGQLKTIGTTKRQIKRIVRSQIFRTAVIGIPSGLIVGGIVSLGLVPFAMNMMYSSDTDLGEIVSFSPIIFAGAAIFTFFTAIIGSMKPAKIAASISPVAASRYTEANTRSYRDHKSHRTKLSRMARDNIFRNPKSAFLTFASLFLGLILFLVSAGLLSSLSPDNFVNQWGESDFALTYSISEEGNLLSDEMLQQIETMQGIENLRVTYSASPWPTMDVIYDENVFGKYIDSLDGVSGLDFSNAETRKNYTDNFWSGVYGIDSRYIEELNKTLDKPIDLTAFEKGELVVLSAMTDDEGNLLIQPGQAITVVGESGEQVFTVATGFLDADFQSGRGNERGTAPDLYISEQAIEKLSGETKIFRIAFDTIDSSYDKGIMEQLQSITASSPGITILSRYEKQQEMAGYLLTSRIIAAGLSAVFLLIGIMNFINTMVVSVNTRKHEFATLESIGMTKKQIRNVLLWEGGYYWSISFLLLATLGTAIYIPIYSAFRRMVPYAAFHYPVISLLVVAAIVLLVCLATPVITFMQNVKQSVVERLRQN